MKLKNKVAVITGGAMGNGLGIVNIFCKYGAKVYVLDISDELDKLIEESPGITGYKVDIKDNKKLKKIIEDISKENGGIDILVNNAGIAKLTPFLDTDDDIRDMQFDVNIKGTWNVTKAVIPYMKNGSIINLSSVTGSLVADPGEVAYATTKAALIGFTKAIAIEFVNKKIRCNAVLPGYVMTPMVEGIARDTMPQNHETVIAGIAKSIPMKRLGKVEEVGELVAFLASDESTYITGQSFVIDGGSTLPETTSVGV